MVSSTVQPIFPPLLQPMGGVGSMVFGAGITWWQAAILPASVRASDEVAASGIAVPVDPLSTDAS